jgi:hypothetical protein
LEDKKNFASVEDLRLKKKKCWRAFKFFEDWKNLISVGKVFIFLTEDPKVFIIYGKNVWLWYNKF